jgi:hypothetical protein
VDGIPEHQSPAAIHLIYGSKNAVLGMIWDIVELNI